MNKKQWIIIDWREIIMVAQGNVVLEATYLANDNEEKCAIMMTKESYLDMISKYLNAKEEHTNDASIPMEVITSDDFTPLEDYKMEGINSDGETFPVKFYQINSIKIDMEHESIEDIKKSIQNNLIIESQELTN